jgi:hypothetical protein
VNVEQDCRFDESKPVERWPACADATFFRGRERWQMQWDEEETGNWGRHRRSFAGWERDESIIANGDPLIGQLRMQGDTGPDEELAPTTGTGPIPASEDDAGGGTGEQQGRSFYLYYAIRPTARDEAGRVTAIEAWGVACGPLPKPLLPAKGSRRNRASEELAEDTPSVTRQPFPGLTVVDDNCVAESVEALRRAAVLSETLDEHGKSHWVRDGWR